MYKFVRTKSHTGSKFSKKFLEKLYTGWIVVVHLCFDFSLCRQMAPQQSTKFRTAFFGQFRTSLRKYSVANYASICFLPAGCRKAANCRYCFYSQAKNQVFCPAGATRCTDSGQALRYRRAPGSAWLCKISRQSVQTGENAAPKISKISTFW